MSLCHIYLCADLTYYVEEEKGPGTYLGDLAADSHLLESVPPQDHTLIKFSQLQQGSGSVSPLFHINEKTGKLYTAQTLDAETLCIYNVECFRMVDVAVKRANSFIWILKVKVIIQDINDHQPEFPDKQVNIQFSENDRKGTKISIPNAVDRDIGVLNSQITYQLRKSKDEPFALSVSKSLDGTSKISILLEEGLDRELKDLYMLHIMAKDGGSPPKQSILNIQIYVTDVNDNPPVFSRDVYNVSVKNDNQVASPVVALSARDLDVGKNGRVSYHFSSKTSDIAKSHFELNRGTGDIFLSKRFNSGQKQSYKLYVTATDEGNPPLSSIAIVQINVIDQQNNAPSIDVNFVSASTGDTVAIFEDIEVGSFIAYVKVTDYDMGPNGEVTCNMRHDKFQLEMLGPKEYKIIIKNPVDRETEDYHRLMINCQDKGSPPLHSESQFSIKVMDVNDVQPQFSREIFKFFMYENEKSKSQVGAINATDPDLGPAGKLTYSLLASNKNFLPFQIMDDGVILSIVSLDHEFQDIYKFQVFVKDGGTPSLNNTVNVIVEVKDKNDNAPYFTYPSVNPCSLDVTYYPHHTKNITVLKASDRDSRENAFLKYEIIAGNENQLFTLNHYTGLLSFTRVVNPQDAGLYDLQFLVRDSGTPSLSSTTTLALTLTVSNETSEMLNAVHAQSGDKIHLYLLILVVLVAVTVSVPVTAAMSLCIIRCKDRKNALNRDGESISCKCVSEQGRLICPSHMASYWPDNSSGFMAPDSDLASNSLPANTKRDDSCHGQKGSVLGMRSQKSTEVIYEVSTSISSYPQCHMSDQAGPLADGYLT